MRLSVAARSTLVVLLLTALLAPATLVATAAPAEAATKTERAQKQFVRKINAARERRDLRPVRVKTQVRGVARDWSKVQARTGVLAHNPLYADQISGNWKRVGENVGYVSGGATVRQQVNKLHRMLMRSPGHRANILGKYNRVGVGVKFDPAGTLWLTQNFAKF